MQDDPRFKPIGDVIAGIMANLTEPEEDEASDRILRKLDAGLRSVTDHKFEPGAYGVCRRCGGERNAPLRHL